MRALPGSELMRRGARVAESGGLENRCTFTGTVGSNPTLSAREERQGDKEKRGQGEEETRRIFSPSLCSLVSLSDFWRDRLIGMAPRWKRGGSKGLCGFESRSLRFLISNPEPHLFDLFDLFDLEYQTEMGSSGFDSNIRLRTPCNHEFVNPARTGR